MDPWGKPESSLSWQTYLAPFIVSNKSISPGLSHLPLDSWLPAPSPFPGPRISSTLPGTGQGSSLPTPTTPQAILCQACSLSFCDGLIQQPCYWIPSQSFMTKDKTALEMQGTTFGAHSLAPQPFTFLLWGLALASLFWLLLARKPRPPVILSFMGTYAKKLSQIYNPLNLCMNSSSSNGPACFVSSPNHVYSLP